MITNERTTVRLGLLLTVLVAFMLFFVRALSAQDTIPVMRLTLGDAARLAARQSALVAGARERVNEAQARVRQSRSALLPDVSANAVQSGRTLNSATFGFNFPSPPGQPPILNPAGEIIGPFNTLDLRGRVQANLLDLSALQRVHAAESAVSAASADVSSSAESAAAQAASAYLQVLRSDAQLQARVADSTLATELLGIAQQQLRAGVGVALDVTRARSQLAGVRAQLISARNDRDRSRLNLRRALNLPLDAPLELADSLADETQENLTLDAAAATARALRDRPDLRAAEAQLRAAQQQVTAIRSERLPSISAFGDDGVVGGNTDRLFGGTTSRMLPTYEYGIQLSVSLFDGFRREGRVQEQQAVTRELQVRRRDLEQQAETEVRSTLLDLSSARQEVDAARERLQLAEQEVQQARERFRAGVAGNADVVTASLTLNAARSQYVDALTALQGARVSLARAEGAVTQLR
ncbi:MAG TPA: TolC family protein [Gemmatimonadaceae bacterium]|nr:TolC family protein [Gemmatimonadaceae bacterium]